MDLNPTRGSLRRDDQSWLGSEYGTNHARSVTLATSLFTKATHYKNGYFPSGLALAPVTSGDDKGKFGPYDAEAEDGRTTIAGFLFTATDAPRDGSSDVAGALLDHGRVIVSKLPVSIDSTAQATNGHFIYV